MAIDSNQKPRRLPYPLRNPETQGVSQPETTPEPITFEWETADSDEIVSIRLELSLNEYTALAACVDVGRDIAFNQDADWLWQIWTKAFRGAIMVDCGGIADCIESEQSVQDAIVNVINNSGNVNPDYITEQDAENPIIDDRFPNENRDEIIRQPENCDLDVIWAGILFMVQRLDDRGRDWLEQIVSKADTWQRIAEFAGTVPIVGELSENVLLAFINSAEDILNLYNAYSTPEQLEEIACDLFSMVCAECRYPTYNEVADYYASFAIEDMQDWANIGLRFMVDYLTGSSGLASIVAYYSVITFQLWVMYAEATFFGLRGAKWLAIWLDNGEEFANNAWELLCDPCTPPLSAIRYDFALGELGWYLIGNGQYDADCCWTGTNIDVTPPGSRDDMHIRIDFAGDLPKVAGYIVEITRVDGNAGTGDDRMTVDSSNSGASMANTSFQNGANIRWYRKGFTPATVTFVRMQQRVRNETLNTAKGYVFKIWLIVTSDSALKGDYPMLNWSSLPNTPIGGSLYTGEMP